jgi:hypothetical protein
MKLRARSTKLFARLTEFGTRSTELGTRSMELFTRSMKLGTRTEQLRTRTTELFWTSMMLGTRSISFGARSMKLFTPSISFGGTFFAVEALSSTNKGLKPHSREPGPFAALPRAARNPVREGLAACGDLSKAAARRAESGEGGIRTLGRF